jgi:hypothetical protein
MRLIRTAPDEVALHLNKQELGIICNALNEVCHGLDLSEFSTRLGAEKSEVLKLLHRASTAYQEMENPPKAGS